MRVSKQNATRGKTVVVWRLYIGMPTHAAHPIVLIVYRNKQHIWTRHITFGRKDRPS